MIDSEKYDANLLLISKICLRYRDMIRERYEGIIEILKERVRRFDKEESS